MSKTISLREAMRLTLLNHHPKPVISLHEFNTYLYSLYRDKTFDGSRIGKIQSPEPDSRVLADNLVGIIEQGILSPVISGYVWQLSNRDAATAQQIVCNLTPWSHLAYLSAMEWHGITDRIPHVLHLIQAPLATARNQQLAQLKEKFPDLQNGQPLMVRGFTPHEKIDGKELHQHTRRNYRLRADLHASGGIRVTTIGETFLDMLREPDMCGGYAHVQDVFQEYAADNLPVIVKTVDKIGTSIDKARTGYVLEDICSLTHRTIDSWKAGVQRGGSRKLVASNPYKNEYSEVWCISINN